MAVALGPEPEMQFEKPISDNTWKLDVSRIAADFSDGPRPVIRTDLKTMFFIVA